MYFKKKKDLLLSVVRRCHGEGKGRLTKTEEMSGSKGKDQLDRVLTYSWTAIFFTTLIAFVSLIVGMVRLEVDFLDDGAWENDVDTVSKNRAYIIAIWTMLLSFGVSSYGFWRSCISVRTIQMLDVIFSGGVSATGSMVFICFILFFDWPQEWDEVVEEGLGIFIFAMCCLLLSILFCIIDFASIRKHPKKNKLTTVDHSNLVI